MSDFVRGTVGAKITDDQNHKLDINADGSLNVVLTDGTNDATVVDGTSSVFTDKALVVTMHPLSTDIRPRTNHWANTLGGFNLGSLTAAAQTIAMDDEGVDPHTVGVTISVEVSGTYADAVLAFEAQTNSGAWAPVAGVRSDGKGQHTTEALTNAAYFWTFTVPTNFGYTHFRVRCVSITSGSADVRMITSEWPGPKVNSTTLVDGATVATTRSWTLSTFTDSVNVQLYDSAGNGITMLDGANLGTKQKQASAATLTNVNDSATSVTLLSSNSSRMGATIHNDSAEILYVKFGTTASLTDYTVKMIADAYYEVPFGYTGRLDGIWAANSTGAARITELT